MATEAPVIAVAWRPRQVASRFQRTTDGSSAMQGADDRPVAREHHVEAVEEVADDVRAERAHVRDLEDAVLELVLAVVDDEARGLELLVEVVEADPGRHPHAGDRVRAGEVV